MDAMSRGKSMAAISVALLLATAPPAAASTREQTARQVIAEQVGEDRASLPFDTTEQERGCKFTSPRRFVCRYHLADRYAPRAWWDDAVYVVQWRDGSWSDPRGRHHVMGQVV